MSPADAALFVGEGVTGPENCAPVNRPVSGSETYISRSADKDVLLSAGIPQPRMFLRGSGGGPNIGRLKTDEMP